MLALQLRFDAVIRADMTAAKNVFQTMLDKGLYPTEYHYGAMMEGYVRLGELETAEAVLGTAVKAGIEPNAVLYTTLIAGYGRRKDPSQAMRVLQEMIAMGIKPDIPAIDAMVNAYRITGAEWAAREVLLSLWTVVAPVPKEAHGSSLWTLLRQFRSVRPGNSGLTLSKRKRKLLRWTLRKIVKVWMSSMRVRDRGVHVTTSYRTWPAASDDNSLASNPR